MLRDRNLRQHYANFTLFADAINYYGPVIFMSAGFTSVSASLFLTGIFGVVKVVASLAFMFKCVHVKGNRFWLMLGSTVCGVSMFVLAYCVRASPSPDDAHSTSVVALRTFGILAGSFSADEPQGSSITAVGVTSVLMVYIFSFFFGVSNPEAMTHIKDDRLVLTSSSRSPSAQ